MATKAPEWLSADIQELSPTCQGNIRAMQRAILDKRGTEIAYMTISDRLKRLGLERPRDKQKASKDTPAPRVSEPSEPETAHTAADGAMSAIANIDPVNTGDIDTLSPDETETLQYCEHVIAEGIQTFVEVGRALLVIRDQRLYRQSYATFEGYCRERWDLSRTYAYQLVEASQVVDHVAAVSDVVPRNEAQARPLASLPPTQQQLVWVEAVKTAPPSGITATHVKHTVVRVTGQPTQPKAPEPRRPARQEVQEGLIWGLREVGDEDAWEMLEWLWDGLHDLAPKYASLRGMLARVKRRFPEDHRTLMEIAAKTPATE
jgi:hypothetical protein